MNLMKSKYSLLLLGLSWLLPLYALGNDFNQCFSDSTLRIDYIFAGGPDGVGIFKTAESKQPKWAGRRHNLKNAPIKGNGAILVLSKETKDTLYHNTFSSLFQEWLLTPEAKETPRSFQNSFLLPLPKDEVLIKLELRDNRQKIIKEITHPFYPNDELIEIRGEDPAPHQYLHKGGDPKEVIDIAIVAEGFQQSEMDSFIYHARRFSDEILSYEPFASNKEKFNFVAVKTPSQDHGVSIPLKKEWKNTAFNSHFSTFHSPRYLTVPELHKVHRQLEGIPYEHILIVVNTSEYGGGGIYNSYQVASANNPYTLPVSVHEFAHSFAGLADEYFYADEEDDFYPLDIEPWEPNITTLVDFDSKWKSSLPIQNPLPIFFNDTSSDRVEAINEEVAQIGTQIGLYEGGGYRTKGIYRPTRDCRMRDNKFPKFCEVC